jgi:glycosyltransferase involved in cell wall biosynthesis
MGETAQFDVFLSYNSNDRPVALQLALALKARGLSVWFDKWELRPGESFQDALGRAMQTTKSAAVLVGPGGLGPWQTPEVEICISQLVSRQMPVIPVLLPGAPSPPQLSLPPFLTQLHWVDLRQGLSPDGINALQWGITRINPASHPELSRVCFISSEYPPHVKGGLGVHVKELTKALALTGLDVDVLLPDVKEPYEPCDPKVNCIPLAGVYPSYRDSVSWLFFARAAVDKLANMDPRPNVVHCHDWVTVLAGIKARWGFGIPLVYHLHLPNEDPLCRSIENLGLVCADVVTVSSDALHHDLKSRNLPIRPLKILENGVDIDLFRPTENQLTSDEGGRYILFVGRLVEQKGVEYLLRAFRPIALQFPDVRLRIVGEGTGSLFEDWLNALTTHLMISDRVQFLGWVGHGPELVKLYQGAEIVAMPSIYEPFGMVALEAMACKCPVVASRIGGLRTVVGEDQGRGGLLVEPKDDLDLAQWLMTLLARRELRDELAEQAYRRVVTGPYLWQKIANRTTAIYTDVLKTPLKNTDVRKETVVEIVNWIRSEAQRRAPLPEQLLDDLFDWMVKL